jgi:hypothetical protein
MNSISLGYISTGVGGLVDRELQDIWKELVPMGREGDAKELRGHTCTWCLMHQLIPQVQISSLMVDIACDNGEYDGR